MIILYPSLVSAFLLGIFGSAHCLGMCGGIVSALSVNVHNNKASDNSMRFSKQFTLLLGYNLGRIITYGVAGGLLGVVGWWLGGLHPLFLVVLRYFAALMLIAMGFYLTGWWNGLTYIEGQGKFIWRYIQPFTKRWLPVDTFSKATMTGLLWGWLPCGLVYSTLTWAVASGGNNGFNTILLMIAFGLGTLPSMIASGLFAKFFHKMIRSVTTRNLAGGLIILFGIWTLPVVHKTVLSVIWNNEDSSSTASIKTSCHQSRAIS